MRRALHRLLTGSAAALTAVAALAVPGTPALAAGPAVRLHFPDLAVAGSVPKATPLFAWIDMPRRPGEAPAAFDKMTVRVDTAGVADIATVVAADDFQLSDEQSCGRSGTVISCTLTGHFPLDPGTNLVPLLALEVTAKAGAAQDAHGKLAFSARLDDLPEVTTASTVTIGEGVDLAGVISAPRTVAAGANVDAGLRVSNAGTTPVKSVVLVMLGWDPSLSPGAGFGNCRYGVLTVCTFDDELAAGTTYELTTPMRLKIPADAAAGSRAGALGGWYTPADFEELIDTAPGLDEETLGPKGTGPAAGLRAVPVKGAARAAASQVDTDPKNNILVSEFVVGGRRTDLAAVGATVTGEPGDKVRARVGFVNNGPGTLYHWTFDNTDPSTRIVVPAGLEAVGVDERCFPMTFEDGEEPGDFTTDLTGAPEYLCPLEDGRTKAKASSLFDFTFQVRANPSAAAGRVVINEEIFTEYPIDRDAGNDTAAITVQLSGGQGGGLPVTGADAGLLGAGGALLLLAGAAGLLLVRRRRVRFTA
ncbi:LPXTG cell wall anchor domain-containing protein [Actinoplanes sp. NPDC004185]